MTSKRSAAVALLLLVPAPSLGTAAAMVIAPEAAWSKFFFFACKIWILFIPLLWHFGIEKKPFSWSKLHKGGLGIGLLSGLFISFFIIGGYVLLGRNLINPVLIKEMAAETGLNQLRLYLAGALYWITVNSLLEEVVWRWFAFTRLRLLVPVLWAGIISALFFTLHHVVALQVYLSPLITACAAAGIFIGGAIWCWFYNRYNSIWPGYLSHAIVDVAVFAIGYHLLFQV